MYVIMYLHMIVFFSSIGKCSYDSYHRNEMCLVIEQTELLKVGGIKQHLFYSSLNIVYM